MGCLVAPSDTPALIKNYPGATNTKQL